LSYEVLISLEHLVLPELEAYSYKAKLADLLNKLLRRHSRLRFIVERLLIIEVILTRV
jgi:hypothetical protein